MIKISDEYKCPNCKKLLWASKDDLICPNCNGYKDVSKLKANQLRKSIKESLHILNGILNEISYIEVFRFSVNSLEKIAKLIRNEPYNLHDKINLLDEWIKFSLNLSIIKNFKQKKYSFFLDINKLDCYFLTLDTFAKNFISLIKISLGNIHYFKKNENEIILTSPTKAILSTPNFIFKIQNENAKIPVNSEFFKQFSLLSSFDVNLFEINFYRLIGNYLSQGMGLPRYLVTNVKEEALKLLVLYSKLHQKLKKLPIKNTHVFNEMNFTKLFGAEVSNEIYQYIELGDYSYEQNVFWIPNIFLLAYLNSEKLILPLFFSNSIFEEILIIKTEKRKFGYSANLKGKSFEDEIFAYFETLNITGIFNEKKLIRIPNPDKTSILKELADVIFIGNHTNMVYIISAKSHSVLTLGTLIKELNKFYQEQESIKKGINNLNIETKKLCWLFITPITWLASFRNIKIFDLPQMISLIYHNEGLKSVSLQKKEETLKLKDFKVYGDFSKNDRLFRIEIGKVYDKKKNEITIWVPVEKVNFTLISIDIPDFIKTNHLKIGSWVRILIEYRTKYSTQVMSFHDAEIIKESYAYNLLKRMNIKPPYP